MRPEGRSGELWAAFSTITSRAFIDDRLLSCPTLSKAPNYGRVLERYLNREAPARRGGFFLVRTAARYAAANGGHFLFLVCCALFTRLLGWRLPEGLTGTGSAVILDSFALLPSIAGAGRYEERYMPGLAEAARAHGHRVVRLHRLYGGRGPRLLWRACRVLAAAKSGMLETHLFRWQDWPRLLWHCLSYPLSLYRLIRSLAAFPAGSPEAAIREALVDTAGQGVLIGEARRVAGLRLGLLLAQKPAPVRIFAWYENQTVNKCLQRGLVQAEARTARHVPVIGAQLFLWPPTLLNNHPDDGEAALGLAPDRILVNGPYYLAADSRQDIRVGPSLRYGHLFDPPPEAAAAKAQTHVPGGKYPQPGREERAGKTGNGKNGTTAVRHAKGVDGQRSPCERFGRQAYAREPVLEETQGAGAGLRGPLLVLLSYHTEETARILELVRPLAQTGVPLAYRFHPAVSADDFRDLLEPGCGFSREPLPEALRAAGAVIGAGSGTLAEAAVLGVPVLVVAPRDGEQDGELNYLPPYGQGVVWERVRGPGDVIPALRALRQNHRERAQAALELRSAMFCEPTAERIRDAFELAAAWRSAP